MSTTKIISSKKSKLDITPQIKADCHALSTFPTLCYQARHEGVDDMNKELSAIIRELEQQGREAKYPNSVKEGFHSTSDFFTIDRPAVKQFHALLVKNLQHYLRQYWSSESSLPLADLGDLKLQLWGWSLILREGSISAPHMHPHCMVSGVYYPEIPDDLNTSKNAGCFILCDPRPRAAVVPLKGQGNTLVIKPETGLLLMFPSYMEHYVMPFKGTSERLSIAFNVDLPLHAKG
ncbi:MAG: hypothetical protein IPP74_04860 [Alphaproteobacteria bacterium]|nr:hypothetical protein [Alphaproteobacteria bacterium]